MRVGVLKITLVVPSSSSLKQKRKVLHSIKDRLRVKFNVSVAETDSQNHRQIATIGVATISNDSRHLQSVLNKIADFVRNCPYAEIINTEMDIY